MHSANFNAPKASIAQGGTLLIAPGLNISCAAMQPSLSACTRTPGQHEDTPITEEEERESSRQNLTLPVVCKQLASKQATYTQVGR